MPSEFIEIKSPGIPRIIFKRGLLPLQEPGWFPDIFSGISFFKQIITKSFRL